MNADQAGSKGALMACNKFYIDSMCVFSDYFDVIGVNPRSSAVNIL